MEEGEEGEGWCGRSQVVWKKVKGGVEEEEMLTLDPLVDDGVERRRLARSRRLRELGAVLN